ncbi:hypothetical protein TSOC_005617 [Tetrabaena socialis]|uniref:Uncharacterized protein n=1 Tax=Tetrabaena socialis TaxID=47790 RepID=A0A2J8A5W1_9CHLO|nr:hypothetical protein TSOC_005617 [Tetrabaena socialis]|eukprot:PNH07883.1 hypothetical protein TSOC_005617 [Tetrabaena socialis]
MQALKTFQLQRADDFAALFALAQQAWSSRSLAALDALPQSAMYTAIGTILAAQLVLVLLSRTGRRIVLTTADTILALVLLGILLLTILSLPIVLVCSVRSCG